MLNRIIETKKTFEVFEGSHNAEYAIKEAIRDFGKQYGLSNPEVAAVVAQSYGLTVTDEDFWKNYDEPRCNRKGCAHKGACGYGAP